MSSNPIIVAPSILAGDHADLAGSLKVIDGAGAPWVHLDLMDGHFVPNLTFGPGTVRALRKRSGLFFDVHLMLSQPHRFVEAFADAGADQISIHVEPEYDIAGTLEEIRAYGLKRGIVFNPDTPASAVMPFLAGVDLVLAMTVQPGFGGQSFREDVLPKIEELAAFREKEGLSFRIEVDGGVDRTTGPRCVAAGADTLVAGTAFFRESPPAAFVNDLSRLV